MTTITDAELQALVEIEFLSLADVLATAPSAAWDTPSLCDGWRVKEVVAHMTMAARYDEQQFLAQLAETQFDFTALSNKVASRDAELSTQQLLGDLRSPVMHRWTPPGGGARGALNHVVVHGLDITVPLGVPRTTSDQAIKIVLDDLTAGGVHAHFGTSITGRRLAATDIDWSYGGDGSEHMGTAAQLVLHLCGRHI